MHSGKIILRSETSRACMMAEKERKIAWKQYPLFRVMGLVSKPISAEISG